MEGRFQLNMRKNCWPYILSVCEASWSWEHVRKTVRGVTLGGHQLRPLQKEQWGTAQGCPEHPTPFFWALHAWRESPLLTTHNDHINWVY